MDSNTNTNKSKTCIKCERELPLSPMYFFRMKRDPSGFESRCKECRGFKFREPYKPKEGYKRCYGCKRELEINAENFHRCKRNKDGFVFLCKSCTRQKEKDYIEKNRDKIKQKNKEWYSRVKEEEKARRKRYYQDNKEEIKRKRKEYYKENKEQILEYYKKYRINNKEEIRKKQKEYFSSPRGQQMIQRHSAIRRSRMKGLPSTLKYDEWIESIEYFSNSCAYCGKEGGKFHQEHLIPMCKGGYYTKQNIIPACKSCNLSKGEKDLMEWYPKQTFYSEKRLNKINKWAGIKNDAQQLALL